MNPDHCESRPPSGTSYTPYGHSPERTKISGKEYLATRMFKDRTSAEREYEALAGRGYTAKDINVVMTEEGRKRHFSEGAAKTELGNKALETKRLAEGDCSDTTVPGEVVSSFPETRVLSSWLAVCCQHHLALVGAA